MSAAPALAASRPDDEQKKIDWLLSSIASSPARFVRNGAEYDGAKAAGHLKQKLWFAGKRVQTAQDFIGGIASHSEETKKPYEVHFPDGKQVKLGDWLVERLLTYGKDLGATSTALAH